MKATLKTETKRILVVDDQIPNTRLLKRYLEGTNDYVVREENDAHAALSAAEEFRPHLILLDVMMPGMDGGELATRFRASPKLQSVPIVFLTAAVTKKEVYAGGGLIGGCRSWRNRSSSPKCSPASSNTWGPTLNRAIEIEHYEYHKETDPRRGRPGQ
jgi:two-component system, OmpR family, response regulator